MNSNKLQEKEARLRENLRNLGSLAVAFSCGVDSTFLLKVAHEELGDRLLAVTAKGSVFSGRDLSLGKEFCRQEGIRQEIVEMNELEIPGFQDNPPDRCYICKKTIFQSLLDTAASHGIAHVAEGSNMDDLGDYRPGLRALRELQVLSPLKEAGLYKEEIRQLSRDLHLTPGTNLPPPAWPPVSPTANGLPGKNSAWWSRQKISWRIKVSGRFGCASTGPIWPGWRWRRNSGRSCCL